MTASAPCGRILIVHDQAADLGGHERAVEALLERYPDATALAPRFSATNRPGGHAAPSDGRRRLVGRGGRRRPYLAPLYGRVVARAGVHDCEVVVSVTQNGWSLAARAPAAVHVCYSGGLPPHLYGYSRRYLRDQPPALRPVLAASLPALRAYDRHLMRRPGRLIANSRFSARQLLEVHGRAADVVHPPVRAEFFTAADVPRSHFLVVARLISFKQVDVVVDAFRGLREELVVAGGGPMLAELSRTAPPNVRFAGPCDDEALLRLYRSSRALICPSLETFGLAMAESHATGTPVIARRGGGALEIVTDPRTGILLDRPTPRSISEAVSALDSAGLDAGACRRSAERFGQAVFTDAIDRIIQEELVSRQAPRR